MLVVLPCCVKLYMLRCMLLQCVHSVCVSGCRCEASCCASAGVVAMMFWCGVAHSNNPLASL